MKAVEEHPILPSGGTLEASFNALLKELLRLFSISGYRLNRVLPKDGTEAMAAPLELMTYTVATLPTASDWAGAVIYVSDGGSGAVFRGSNGTAWVNLG